MTAPRDATLTLSGEAVLGVVRDFISELHPGAHGQASITLDSSLERELGIDSLARMELLMRVERAFDLSLPEQVMAAVETPRDVLRAALGAGRRSGSATPRHLDVTPHSGTGGSAKPDAARTLTEVLDWHVRAHPDRVHIHLYADDEQATALSYRALHSGALSVAASLQAAGVAPGHTVAIMLPTCTAYFHCFMGVLLAGATPVPIYPPVRLSQIEEHVRRHARILRNAGVRVLISFPEAKAATLLLLSQLDGLDRVLGVDELMGPEAPLEMPAIACHDIAFLQYTSGSTGDPKGVVLTHDNILANLRAMDAALATSPDDVFVSWLPLYHDMGLIGAWMGSLYVGFTLVLMSPLAFIARPERWLRAMHTHRATISGGPNFAFELCLRRVEDADIAGLDLSRWRYVFNGAEPVSADTLRRFEARFACYGLRAEAIAPVYGLAEATLGIGFPPLERGLLTERVKRAPLTVEGRAVLAAEDDTDAIEIVACGQPMAGYQVRIVDPSGRELPERRQGRLQFKGPSTTSGYYRNAAATRALFDGEWLESGDMAYIAGGDIYITGRHKDVIIRAGRNIHPHELEREAGAVDGVRKGCVAVFGSTDARVRTERLVVVAEIREAARPRAEAIRRRINELSLALVDAPPDDIVLAPPRTVLKTSSGKIRRAAMRERYEQGRLGSAHAGVRMLRLAGAGLLGVARRARRRGAESLYALWAWTLAACLGLACWLAVMSLPRASWRWSAVRAAGRCFFALSATRVTVSGLTNLPRGTPYVLVCNHQSYLDGPLLAASIPRTIGYVVKGELEKNRLVAPALRRLAVEFVERFDARRSVDDARRISRALQSGKAMGFFPEGTLGRMPGLLPFHMGAFLSAAEARVPVVPVTIRGTRSILRDESWYPRRGAVQLIVSEPIAAPDPDAPAWERALGLRDAARAEILGRCAEPNLSGHRMEIPAPATKRPA